MMQVSSESRKTPETETLECNACLTAWPDFCVPASGIHVYAYNRRLPAILSNNPESLPSLLASKPETELAQSNGPGCCRPKPLSEGKQI